MQSTLWTFFFPFSLQLRHHNSLSICSILVSVMSGRNTRSTSASKSKEKGTPSTPSMPQEDQGKGQDKKIKQMKTTQKESEPNDNKREVKKPAGKRKVSHRVSSRFEGSTVSIGQPTFTKPSIRRILATKETKPLL